MGWSNPDVPWAELEGVLSGRLSGRNGSSLTGGPEADGGDSPAWSRKRAPYEPPPQLPLDRIVWIIIEVYCAQIRADRFRHQGLCYLFRCKLRGKG